MNVLILGPPAHPHQPTDRLLLGLRQARPDWNVWSVPDQNHVYLSPESDLHGLGLTRIPMPEISITEWNLLISTTTKYHEGQIGVELLLATIPNDVPLVTVDMALKLDGPNPWEGGGVITGGHPVIARFSRLPSDDTSVLPFAHCDPYVIRGNLPWSERDLEIHSMLGDSVPGSPRPRGVLHYRLHEWVQEQDLLPSQIFLGRSPFSSYIFELNKAKRVIVPWGIGKDTLRFWEGFAHGACVFAQDPEIRIPNAPEPGVDYIQWETVDELFDLILTTDNDTIHSIADRGNACFLFYHTAKARANYILSHVEHKLCLT